MRTYLGQIESHIDRVMVYYNDDGYEIDFFSKNKLIASCQLLDDDHVWRELKARGYKKFYRRVIINML